MAELTQIDSKVEKGPIVLSYIYKGACPTCNSPVETLEQDIEIDGKVHHFVLAYCLNCKKQVETKKVPKLEN